MPLRYCLFLFLALSAGAQTHFQYVRPVSVGNPGKQAYVVVDEALLQSLQTSMGDLRLFSDSGREVQYVLREQRAIRYSNWISAKIINKGSLQGDAHFSVEVDEPEYDCLRIENAARDFVAKATVEGADTFSGGTWNNLGTYSLYDFSKEKLGANDTIRLKSPARYRYLRITISGGVPAQDIQDVKIANLQEAKASYILLAVQPRIEQMGNRTVAKWNVSDKIPMERLVIDVASNEINFSREAQLFCDNRPVSAVEVSRVRLERTGRLVESESLAIEPYSTRCKSYRLEIANGDNPPLHISAVKPMMLERRIYFEPKDEIAFKLYYGDEKTNAPQYDYARFFEPADAARSSQAQLQAAAQNPGFTPWPDTRPWSERNKGLLWVAMIAAVGLLGAWALKGFKS
jgi:hypothetical protein